MRHLPKPARRRRDFVCRATAQGNTAEPPVDRVVPPVGPRQRSRAPVTLNFVNADIEAVSRAMGVMLNRPLIVDPRVKGTITVYSEQPLSIRDAYLQYLAALRGLGFTVVENAGLLKVVPEADAKLQAGTVSVGPVQQRGDQVVTQVFRLNYENPNNLVTVLRPLISPNNTINANPGNNTLVITDYADNLQRIARIIAALDSPSATDIEVIQLQHAVAADVAPLVQRLADGSTGGPVIPGAPPGIGGAGGVSVLVDPRSNSLIVRASNPARLASVRSIIEKLDRPAGSSGPGGNIYVVYLKNADAVKLAQVLRAAFSGGGGGGGGGAGTTGTGAPSATTQSNVTSLGGTAAGGTMQSPANTPVQASQAPSTGGFVQADPATNSLIITAPEPMYRQVRAVIDQLDSRRSQVFVEALIVEIDANRSAELGLQWLLLAGNKDASQVTAGAGSTSNLGAANLLTIVQALVGGSSASSSSAGPSIPSLGGFTAAGVNRFGPNGRYGLAVLARAFESVDGANILSTPNLVTLDNEEAKIVVGQNVPFITGSFTNTGTGTGAVNPFQTVERKDVGLTLRIKPQIGEGSSVRMTIFQENSDVLNVSVPGTANAGPSTTKRSIESTVVVDDGQVVVLGGLIDDRFNVNRTKVPLLGDLPLVGNLFRSETRSRNKTNLMVFLRPVVMRTQEAADKVSLDRYDVIRGQQLETQPPQRKLLPVNEAPLLPPIQKLTPGEPLIVPVPPQVQPLPQQPPASAPH
ncbi:MAG TPA: type II secretion system secretin GspD [Burkholderiaceae bacterium]|nr:type II secretion system secretin GspD [Burkholderiaceae bacterium]